MDRACHLPAAPVLDTQALHKTDRLRAHTAPALRGVSLQLPPGEPPALTGPSGRCKSTLLNLAGRIDAPDTGCILLQGADVTQLDAGDAKRVRRFDRVLALRDSGALEALGVVVAGTFGTGVPDLERRQVHTDLATAQTLLLTPRIGTLGVFLDRMDAAWRRLGGPSLALLAQLPQRHTAVLLATWSF